VEGGRSLSSPALSSGLDHGIRRFRLQRDFVPKPVLGGYAIGHRSDPSCPITSPTGTSPVSDKAGYEFRSDYAHANVKPE
jgi:hypothetical protein